MRFAVIVKHAGRVTVRDVRDGLSDPFPIAGDGGDEIEIAVIARPRQGIVRRLKDIAGALSVACAIVALVLFGALGAEAATLTPAPGGLAPTFKLARDGDVVQLGCGHYSASLYGPTYDHTGAGVTVQSQACTSFDGFVIQKAGGYHFTGSGLFLLAPGQSQAMGLSGAHDVTIDGARFAQQPGATPDQVRLLFGVGVRIDSSSGISVRNADFGWIGYGLAHTASSGLTITDNTVHDISNDGIRGGCSSHVLIARNAFTAFYAATAADGTRVHFDPVQFWTSNCTAASDDIQILDNQELRGPGDPGSLLQMGDEADRPQGRSWTEIRFGYTHLLVAGNLLGMGGNFTIEGAIDAVIRDNAIASSMTDAHLMSDGSASAITSKITLTHSLRGQVFDNVAATAPVFYLPIEPGVASDNIVNPLMRAQAEADREYIGEIWLAGRRQARAGDVSPAP